VSVSRCKGLFMGLCMVAFKVRIMLTFCHPSSSMLWGFEDCMLLRAQSLCQNLGVFAVLTLKQ